MLSRNPAALKILLTDDLYMIRNGSEAAVPVSPPKIEQQPEPETEPETVKAVFTGHFSNGFVILFEDAASATLDPESDTALRKVLAARNTNPDDWAFVNLSGQNITFADILSQFQPKKILLLGINNQKAGLDDLAYNTPLVRDDVHLLYTYAMRDMLSDVVRKKEFWEGFKSFIDA
ncbi:MAG: hypothetical protein INR69_16145 [Mucilaginibacter polytrichastri]|nr:hypothetical protein [Mucilaginibacter polytrichastri]